MDNNLISSHIGNLAQTGKDFNVIVTNAPFKLLSSLDKIYRTGRSNDGGNGTTTATNNGMGTKIANSFMICAPQIPDEYTTYNYVANVAYIDRDNNGQYTYGDTQLYNDAYTYVHTSYNAYKDTGEFDLVATDAYGIPVALTPPFNDIDKNYFDVRSDIPSRYRDYCHSRSLTLSENFSKQFGGIGEYIGYIGYSYTPIVIDYDKTTYFIRASQKVGQANQRPLYFVGKMDEVSPKGVLSYKAQIGNVNKYLDPSITYDDEYNYEYIPVSFEYLLNEVDKIKDWKTTQFPNTSDNTSYAWNEGENIEDSSSILKKLSYLMKTVSKLNNLPYVLNRTGSTSKDISYLWSGSMSDYEGIPKSDKDNKTTFIIENNDK